MANPLIVLHVLAGLGGSLLPLWIALEMSKPFKEISVRYVKIASAVSLILILASWFIGGLYYVNIYGSQVKPAVLSAQPWIHSIVMETKEHIFLFMPFLALLLNSLVWGDFEKKKRFVAAVALFLVILGLIMTGTGFAISGAREAAGVIV